MPASMETPSSEHANLGKRAPQLHHTHAQVIQSGRGDDGDGDGVLLLFVSYSGTYSVSQMRAEGPPLP